MLTETARTIFERALADCSVEQAMARHVAVRNGQLHIDGAMFDLAGLCIRIVAAGKAGHTMLAALLRRLPPGDIAGVLIAPEALSPLPGDFQYFDGGHPMPNAASLAGARAALDLARAAAKRPASTLCLFLISGGASAMMELPLDSAIAIEETIAFHRALVASGAPIAEMNCVRKHFSAVKGGRLALAAGGARCFSLLVSDVPSGRRDALASGPTVPDSSTVEQCREILARYGLLERFPATVRRFFESAELPETPKADEISARSCTLLDSDDLARAAAHHAEALGWTAVIDNACDEWEYREAARYLLDRLQTLRRDGARICLISTGEVSVALPPDSVGVGGRNQQFALFAAMQLTRADGEVAILSAGSDGIDGNSPVAGAVVDRETLKREGPMESLRELTDFDAYPLLERQRATLTTGPTGNNLRDLRILLAERSTNHDFLHNP